MVNIGDSGSKPLLPKHDPPNLAPAQTITHPQQVLVRELDTAGDDSDPSECYTQLTVGRGKIGRAVARDELKMREK